MSNSLSPVISSLLGQTPSMLAYLAGLIVALILWGRYPRPAALLLIASVLMLLATIGFTFAQYQIIDPRRRAALTSMQIGQALNALNWMANLVRAGCFGLLIWAVFAGRSGEVGRGFPVTPPPLGGTRFG